MARRRPHPINELVRRLKDDPVVAARWKQERVELRKRVIEQSRADEAPVLEALQAAGCDVDSVSALASRLAAHPQVIPVLLEELQKPHQPAVIGAIARILAVREAWHAWPILLREYRKWPPRQTNELGAKDGLAVALAATATSSTLDELISIAKDAQQGQTRIFLLRALRRSRDPRARKAIEELAFDPDLAIEIASWRKRKTKHDH